MRREIGYQGEDVRPAGELRKLAPESGEVAGHVAAVKRAGRGAGEVRTVEVDGSGLQPAALVEREAEIVDRRRCGRCERRGGGVALQRRGDVPLGAKQHAAGVVRIRLMSVDGEGPIAD